MNLELQDKVIIVSGGAKGIGEGIVNVLAAEGAIPFIVGRNENDNLAALKAVESAGGKGYQTVAELTKPEACSAAVKTVLDRFGRIDGLVNNAGVNDGVGLEHGNCQEIIMHEIFVQRIHKGLVIAVLEPYPIVDPGIVDEPVDAAKPIKHSPDRSLGGRWVGELGDGLEGLAASRFNRGYRCPVIGFIAADDEWECAFGSQNLDDAFADA